jgi:hypothetical protein
MPALIRVNVVPLTAQTLGVVLANVTGLPDAPPVAVKVNGASPAVALVGSTKVIVWPAIMGTLLVVNTVIPGETPRLATGVTSKHTYWPSSLLVSGIS